jgi:hypothetical protein
MHSLQNLRTAIREQHFASEAQCISAVVDRYELSSGQRQAASHRAENLIEDIRADTRPG